MTHLATTPKQSADRFNAKVPGAHRQIRVDDVKDMVTCGLIGKFECFLDLDLETVRAVLRYERLRENRQKRDEIKDDDGVIHCRVCGVALVAEPKGKRGRPNEYCDRCQPLRGRERNRKWRSRIKAARR